MTCTYKKRYHMIKHFSGIPDSQRLPVYPGLQSHSNPFTLPIHADSCKHGLLAQAFDSTHWIQHHTHHVRLVYHCIRNQCIDIKAVASSIYK